MEQAELEVLVGELETRMERLRTLYDMYFMGIERLEPMVPKKDVERRMQTLRKEQIRNTGLRFRFQTVIQRFNTYQTYWLRISRQIEQGTYARDVKRAAARFGVDPLRERPQEEAPPKDEAEEEKRQEANVYELPEELEPIEGDPSLLEPIEGDPALLEPIEGDSLLLLPMDEDGGAAQSPVRPAARENDPFAHIAAPPARPVPRVAIERFAKETTFELDELVDDPFEEVDPFPKPVGAPNGPAVRIARRADTAVPAPQDTHRDTERRVPAAAPRVVIAKRASIPEEVERQAAPKPPPVPPPPPVSAAPRSPAAPPLPPSAQPAQAAAPAAPRAQAAQARSAEPPTRPRGTLPSGGLFTKAISAPSKAPGAPSSFPSLPDSDSTSPAPPAVPSTTPAGAPRVAAPRASPPKPASPAAPSAPQATAPRAAAPPAAAAPPPAARIGDLSNDRFGEIFSRYVETRQKQKEPTHAITREALAKQLSDSTQRLKEKHAGKAIDFEVVVKDGKTILRPVVK